MPTKAKHAPKKRGDAKVTREKIIQIARNLFFERGYEAVGLREIASQAGVTAAMINRYFGTKEALFIKLMGDSFSFSPTKVGSRAEFGKNIAHQLLLQPYAMYETRSEQELHFKRSNIVIRSAGIDGAPRQIQEFLDRQLWKPLIAWLGGENAVERAHMIVGTILGVLLLSKSISSYSAENIQLTVLADILAVAIQRM